jgi:hypothetical protein
MSKTTPKRTAKPSFFQVVLEGSPKLVCGFLNGLMMGSGKEGTVFFCHDEGIDYESLTGRLAELIHLHPRDCHVIVDRETQSYLKRLAPRIEQTLGLKILSSRHIRSATLPFHFVAYARRYGVEIMGKLHSLPDGVRLVDFEKKERKDPSAAGIETYAPAHEYEIKGEGKIVGRVDLVILARRDLDSHPLIEPGKIELQLA